MIGRRMVSRFLLQRRSSGPGGVQETNGAAVDHHPTPDPTAVIVVEKGSARGKKPPKLAVVTKDATTTKRRSRKRFPFFLSRHGTAKAAAATQDCERREEAAALSVSNSSGSSSSSSSGDVPLHRPAQILVSPPAAAASTDSPRAAAAPHRNRTGASNSSNPQQPRPLREPPRTAVPEKRSDGALLSVEPPPPPQSSSSSSALCSSFAAGGGGGGQSSSYLERMCGVDTTTTNTTATVPNQRVAAAAETATRRTAKGDDNDNDDGDDGSSDDSSSTKYYLSRVPDDPSVQESIECVLAATRQAIPLLKDEGQEESSHQRDNGTDDAVDDDDGDPFSHLQTPSSLQQCLLRNRSISALPPRMQIETRLLSPAAQVQRRSSSVDDNLAFLLQQHPPHPPQLEPGGSSSFDSARAEAKLHAKATETPHRAGHCCACGNQRLPATPPDRWPQRPLLMRPTPHSGTVLKGIRLAGSAEYLWEAKSDGGGPTATSPLSWPDALHRTWNPGSPPPKAPRPGATAAAGDRMCPQCTIMPINNGREPPGESLVTDFESPGFEGSILVRLRDSRGTTRAGREREAGYFDGVHRKYQVVVRGRFKHAVPWTDCLVGFQLERPCGKLPPKWIVKGALNVVSFFAPQLQTRIHGARPFSLTPLGSTPQSLSVHDASDKESRTDTHMEIPLEEPLNCENTLLGKASKHTSSMQRARFRKKNFDKLFAQREQTPVTDPNKVYTFEFLQHLLSFDDFEIQLGSIMGTIQLKNILDGQPLQIMASHKHPNPNQPNAVHNRLWCFDIWHEMLIPDAKRHEFGV